MLTTVEKRLIVSLRCSVDGAVHGVPKGSGQPSGSRRHARWVEALVSAGWADVLADAESGRSISPVTLKGSEAALLLLTTVDVLTCPCPRTRIMSTTGA